MPQSNPQLPSPRPSTRKRLRKYLLTLIKITIAIIGIWWVTRSVSWNDSAELPAGSEIRAVRFPEKVQVRVVSQWTPAAGKAELVRIEFPNSPVPVEVDGRRLTLLIAESTPVPDRGELGLAHQVEIPLDYLAAIKGQRVQGGLRSLLVQASAKWYLLFFAWLLLGIPFFFTAIRWRNLMRPQGIDMPLGKCLQLTFVGQFYSIILPGITGGDLVKIVYAARLTGSKTKSFITIILDRVIGLIALMVIAGTSAGTQLVLNARQGVPLGESPLLNVFILIVVMLLAIAASATIYFSRRLRRIAGIEWFIDNFGKDPDASASVQTGPHLERLFRIMNGMLLLLSIAGILSLVSLRWFAHTAWAQKNGPIVFIGIALFLLTTFVAAAGLVFHRQLVNRASPWIDKLVQLIIGIDETLHVYRGHVGLLIGSFLISLISQMTLPLSAWLSGMAFGMNAPVTHYMAYVPLAILAASLPISPPQGAGFLEWVLDHFFVSKGQATASQAFALTQSVRFLPILWNLMGAYWVVTGKYSRKKETQSAA